MGGSPSAHAKGESRIAPSLRRGLGYLALDPDDTVSSFLRLLAEAHTPFLWLTTEQPRAPAEGGEVLRVTTIRGAGTARSEERRVGKECRARWSRCHEKKKVK